MSKGIMEDLGGLSPKELRELFRTNELIIPTAGLCQNYVQANLLIIPGKYAEDFEEFARRNPKPCPILEFVKGTEPISKTVAPGSDITRDFPLYRVYRNGVAGNDIPDVSELWQADMVGALIGCSLTFEARLAAAGIRIANFENNTRVPMYDTNIACEPYGVFHGNYVVSMRPMSPEQAEMAVEITKPMTYAHGAPVHIGDPSEIGITDVMHPDYGDPPDFREGDVPVFWACGVTAQAVAVESCPELVIAHSPGYMLITDVDIKTLK